VGWALSGADLTLGRLFGFDALAQALAAVAGDAGPAQDFQCQPRPRKGRRGCRVPAGGQFFNERKLALAKIF